MSTILGLLSEVIILSDSLCLYNVITILNGQSLINDESPELNLSFSAAAAVTVARINKFILFYNSSI